MDSPLFACIFIGWCCIGLAAWAGVLIEDSLRASIRTCGRVIFVLSCLGLVTDLGTYAFGNPLVFWRFGWLFGAN